MSGVIGKFKSVEFYGFEAPAYTSSNSRMYCMRPGDRFVVNAYGIEKSFGIKIKNLNLYDNIYFGTWIRCIEKIKRKWWQIWKPKYIAAKFMVVGEEWERYDIEEKADAFDNNQQDDCSSITT